MKYLYFDTESTGIDTIKDHPFALAVIIDIDDTTVFERYYMMRPPQYAIDNMSNDAVKVHGYTKEHLESLPDNNLVYRKFSKDLSDYIDKYDKSDKLIPVAYNGMFDISMVSNWAAINDDKYIGSFINRKRLYDPLSLIRILETHRIIPELEHHKLKDVCDFFNIALENAHDALADTRALRNLHKLLKDSLTFTLDYKSFVTTEQHPFPSCKYCTMRKSTVICNNCKAHTYDFDNPSHFIKEIS